MSAGTLRSLSRPQSRGARQSGAVWRRGRDHPQQPCGCFSSRCSQSSSCYHGPGAEGERGQKGSANFHPHLALLSHGKKTALEVQECLSHLYSLTRLINTILTSQSCPDFFFPRDSCSFLGSRLKTSFLITCTLCCSKKNCDELEEEKPTNAYIHDFSFSFQFYRMLLEMWLEQLLSAVSVLCKLVRQWHNTQKLQWEWS